MAWAPLVGGLLGLVVAAVMFTCRLAFADEPGPLLPVAVAVALLALLTRGLHLDGLADTVDGLGSHDRPSGAGGSCARRRSGRSGPRP